MAFVVPPGGLAGFSQMTSASKRSLFPGGGGGGGQRRRKARKAPKAKRARRAKAKRGGKMKFGSPAWQKKYKVGKFRK
jgi:hypothetical protein